MLTTETWQHRDIITNGIRMHYVTQGTGELVVLLHGFPEFWYSWRHQILFLAEQGYRVVAPDLRGYNDTDKPRKGYNVSTLLRDIVGLIKGLGEEKAIIVGHDWGGALAWEFATRYPQMTERLIIINAPHPAAFARDLRTPQQLRKSWYAFAFQIPWLPEFLLGRNHAAFIGKMIYAAAVQKTAFPPEVLAKYQDAMSKPRALTASINYYRSAFSVGTMFTTLRNRVQTNINAPTLLIWGDQDIALGVNLTRGLEQWVPNLRIKHLPDSGHWVQEEKPEEVNTFLLEFLSQ